jgi:hypothetical protein
MIRKDWFAPDSSDGDYDDVVDDDDDDDGVVTREMLHRDLLNMEPKVMRKRRDGKGGSNNKEKGYKPLDNRDSLPFSVRHVTPDPYTHPDIKRLRQKKAPPLSGKKKTTDLQTALSRLYNLTDDDQKTNGKGKNDPSTLLGEFQLDKSTTSGYVHGCGQNCHTWSVISWCLMERCMETWMTFV